MSTRFAALIRWGSYHRYQSNGVRAGEVGMYEPMPKNYIGQMTWPFAGEATISNAICPSLK